MIDYAVRLAREQRADEILVAVGWNNTELLQTVKSRLSVSAVPARLVPDRALTPVLERGRVWRPRPMLTVELQRAPLSNAERRAKRVFDFVLACTALVVLSPIMAMAAAAVRWDTPGPVLFRQRRTGFDGEKFSIFKFRTMNVMEDGAHVVQARRDDARITRTGAFLRRTSIDELPQLFNVLRGEMSLVGPRPHAVCHDQHYQKLISEYVFRFHVKPGITGWAQVHGCRGEISRLEDMEHRLALDLWYVRNWSFQTDLRIIIRTCFEIMRQDAY
jgi:undecaprenyl-phosphate galactose phosphotransferase/putative colanic acid biosynthesis UDP-glucose lipid carrier transferase